MPYPKAFLNQKNRSGPYVANNASDEALLDPAEWMPLPLANPPDAGMYPKLMYNVNIPPVIVLDRDHQASLGNDWRPSPVVIPNDPPVKLDPESDSIDQNGGSGTFSVTITGAGKSNVWTATKDDWATWISFAPTAPQGADGTVSYTCDSNLPSTNPPRTAYIYVNGSTFTIDQV